MWSIWHDAPLDRIRGRVKFSVEYFEGYEFMEDTLTDELSVRCGFDIGNIKSVIREEVSGRVMI